MITRETHPHFYDPVDAKLEKDALDFLDNMHQAHEAAQSCRCLQCLKWAESADRVVEDEAYRLYYEPAIDHEENWIADQKVDWR